MSAAPAGKRERRKHQTRAALVAQAQRLFRERGFERTRIEDVASAAGIAVGTCYNYFERKPDLLIAVVLDSDRTAIAEAEPIFDSLPDDPAAALTAIGLHDSRHSMAALDKPGWRHLLAATLEHPDTAFARSYAETTLELRGLMIRGLTQLHARGSLPADLDTLGVARTVFAAKYMLFIDHVSDDAAPFSQHEAEVRQAIDIVVNGLLGPRPS